MKFSDYFGPYHLLENEFKIRFDVKLKNKSIFPNDDFQLNIIQSTIYQKEKVEFILDEINSDNIDMNLALGHTISSLCCCNPQGNILVFFCISFILKSLLSFLSSLLLFIFSKFIVIKGIISFVISSLCFLFQ